MPRYIPHDTRDTNAAIHDSSSRGLTDWVPLLLTTRALFLPLSTLANRTKSAGAPTTCSMGGGVAWMLWTGKPWEEKLASHTGNPGKRPARVAKHTPATVVFVQAIVDFAPRDNQAVRRESFKVAAPLTTTEMRDNTVLTWAGDCGLVDIISSDDLVHILTLSGHHTCFVWTELLWRATEI